MKNWESEQAWDEYAEETKEWNKILALRCKLDKQLDSWIKEEKERYEKKVAPLMPLIRERLFQEIAMRDGKAGEELREMQPLEKE